MNSHVRETVKDKEKVETDIAGLCVVLCIELHETQAFTVL